MNGDIDSLRQSLARLHQELSQAPQLDADSRALLTEIARDIERLNRAAPPSVAPSVPERGSRRRRLETLAVEFEGEHPSIAAALREIVDLLGQAGI